MKRTKLFSTLTFSILTLSMMTGCDSSSKYSVKFVNYDDTLLQEFVNLDKGAEIEYSMNKPMRFDDSENYYVFKGWNKQVTAVEGNATYKAEFDAFPLTNVPESPVQYEEKLPEATKDGNILHAFCWRYEDIKNQLPFIKNAGYKSVQIMPVQTPKSSGSSWWAFYQPLSFRIADNDESPIGTKQELKELCDEAEEYDISIIADIVFNHMANISDDDLEEDGTPKVFPGVEDYEPYIYQHRNDAENPTFHHLTSKTAEGSGKETQYYPYGGLPDLNTGNEYVQERCYSLLKECIDVGIDGFRFDAAKHIETADDPNYSSSFWENTLGKAKTYYKTKTGDDLFAYGEVLGQPSYRGIDVYTNRMLVNDDTYGTVINYAISAQNAEMAANSSYKVDNPNQLVGWLESHDSYVEDSAPWSNEFMARGWSALATRKDYRGLYLARPDSGKSPSVGMIGDYFFRDEKVGAVNRFHNRFVGANEALSYDGSILVNERYSSTDKGAIVANFGQARKIIVDFAKLGTDVYYDQITGKAVTVRNGHATLELGSDGFAVLTKSKNGPRPMLSFGDRNRLFVEEKEVEVTYTNATSATYQINGGEKIAFNSGDKIKVTSAQTVQKVVTLTIEVTNDIGTAKETVEFEEATLIPGYYNIVNVSDDTLDNYEIYMWSWQKGGTGHWSKDFFVQGNTILVNTTSLNLEGMVFGKFEKGYVITDVNAWDNNVKKQTTDITGDVLARGYYDGTSF